MRGEEATLLFRAHERKLDDDTSGDTSISNPIPGVELFERVMMDARSSSRASIIKRCEQMQVTNQAPEYKLQRRKVAFTAARDYANRAAPLFRRSLMRTRLDPQPYPPSA